MAKSKKWKIKGLSEKVSLNKAAKIILLQRLKTMASAMKTFLKEETVDNLHDVRISLRRLRYTMEVFATCFDKKKFLIFYERIQSLQDLSGSKRDLDVMEANIKAFGASGGANIPAEIVLQIDSRKKEISESLRNDLTDFISSRIFKDFEKLLK